MELAETFQQLGIAVGLGLLVGLQRQRASAPLAGFRTFPLVTTFGTLCALLAQSFTGWVIVAGLVGIAVLIVVGNYAKWKGGEFDPGLTTEIALLVMFGVGAYLVVGLKPVAIAVGGGVAVLLHLKPQLHDFAAKIGDNDFRAVMQFVLITLVILPVLPDQAFGPFAVLNPHRIWLMVVLIVGISLAGYLAYKLFGAQAGAVLAGVLGGMISSTATTASHARRVRQTGGGTSLAAFVILTASAVVFGRVLLLLGAVAPRQFTYLAPPLAVLLVVAFVVAGALWFASRREKVPMPLHANPAELKPALVFGALFALVLLAVAAAREYFGTQGLFAVALLSGLTDMDAITISSAQMAADAQVPAATGWRLVITAALANLVFKGAVSGVLGGQALFLRVAVAFAVIFATGLGLLWAWPA